MPTPRKRLVCPEVTPYYHCINRCVRRAFLCGIDPYTQKDLSHRKARIEELMFKFAHAFALDICAYAIMSNHYHIVIKLNPNHAQTWSQRDVIERWHQIFRGNPISQRFIKDEILDDDETTSLEKYVASWRERLADLSWYMRVLNERIAREANKEDGYTGRVWESRYVSQALLDDNATLSCMTYVDLNPLRAGLADRPEDSAYTSIQKRIQEHLKTRKQPLDLLPFTGQQHTQGLPFDKIAYFKLIDWTSRKIKHGKAAVSHTQPELLQRLGIDEHQWLNITQNFGSRFKRFVGATSTLRKACDHFKFKYCTGVTACAEAFGT